MTSFLHPNECAGALSAIEQEFHHHFQIQLHLHPLNQHRGLLGYQGFLDQNAAKSIGSACRLFYRKAHRQVAVDGFYDAP